MTDAQLQDFGRIIDYPISYTAKKGGLPKRALAGDKIMHIINVANLYNKSIRDYCIENKQHEFGIELLEEIAERYSDFKVMNSLYDYTDMLIMAKTADLDIPDLEYLFIDEAQDLSTLQWMLVNRLAEKAKHIIIAGDDKQSINEFAGADVDTFLNINGKVEVLEQSYRIPKKVFRAANHVMKHMAKYRPEGATWFPRSEEGFMARVHSLPITHMLSGEWLVLARTGYQLEEIRDALINLSEVGSVLFTVNGAAPIDMDVFRVIDLFNLSAKDERCSMLDFVQFEEDDDNETRKCKIEYIKLFKRYISSGADERLLQPWELTETFKEKLLSKDWCVSMDKLNYHTRLYLKRLYPMYLEKGDRIFSDSKIRLMTIHASKGREADNVLVVMDVPRSVKNTILRRDTDVEVKTLYVAMTRAKKRLYLYTKSNYGPSLNNYL